MTKPIVRKQRCAIYATVGSHGVSPGACLPVVAYSRVLQARVAADFALLRAGAPQTRN
jgi:hypothetical protein